MTNQKYHRSTVPFGFLRFTRELFLSMSPFSLEIDLTLPSFSFLFKGRYRRVRRDSRDCFPTEFREQPRLKSVIYVHLDPTEKFFRETKNNYGLAP